jgi:hypothetical protein
MKQTKRILGVLALALGLSSLAQADDVKRYMGSNCSFADNPLFSHNRVNHVFRNTAGDAQWITCPIVHDVTDPNGVGNSKIEDAQIEISFPAVINTVRLEEREMGSSAVLGWAPNSSVTLTPSTTTRYQWFECGGCFGVAGNNAAYALEAKIEHNTFVQWYRVSEAEF